MTYCIIILDFVVSVQWKTSNEIDVFLLRINWMFCIRFHIMSVGI